MAAANYSRCAAGLEAKPSIPYGTRVMVVKDPAPRNAFVPRSMPATVFGPSDRVPGGLIIFQDGRLKEVVNLQVSSLEPEDLVFVKAHLKDWDTPVAPCEPPATDDWDATKVNQGGGSEVGAAFNG